MKQLVVLLHGILFRSDFLILKYWGKIPSLINVYGYDVAIINTDALGSVTNNVGSTARQLLFILDNYNYDVLHIIGHSKGGVEAIELLRNNILRTRIKTLVLLNSPLRGQNLAIKLVANFKPFSLVLKILNLIGKFQGDISPDSFNAFRELSLDHYNDLKIGNVKVYVIQGKYPAYKLNFPWNLMAVKSYGIDLEGYGLVEYKNLSGKSVSEVPVKSLTDSILTHNSATGLPRFSVQSHACICSFWNNLIKLVLPEIHCEDSENCKVLNIKINRKIMPKLSVRHIK